MTHDRDHYHRARFRKFFRAMRKQHRGRAMMEALASALGFAGAMVVTVAGLVLLAGVIFVWALRNMQKPSRDESEADLIVGDFPNVPAKYPERGR